MSRRRLAVGRSGRPSRRLGLALGHGLSLLPGLQPVEISLGRSSGRPVQGVHFAATVPVNCTAPKTLADGHAEEPAWTGDASQMRGPLRPLSGSTRAASALRRSPRRSRCHRPRLTDRPWRDSPRAGQLDVEKARAVPADGAGSRVGMTDHFPSPTRRSARVAEDLALGWGGRRVSDGEAHGSVRTGDALELSAVGALGLGCGLQAPRVNAPEPALDQRHGVASDRRRLTYGRAGALQGTRDTGEPAGARKPGASGVDWTCQPCRPSVPRACTLASDPPTAVQARSPEQETAREAGVSDVRARLERPARPVPQLDQGRRGRAEPTAKQTFGRGHETPFSELGGRERVGVGTICQLVPSQRSTVAYVSRAGAPQGTREDLVEPTAMHEFADEQSTALSQVPLGPGTFGVGGTVQAADAVEGASSSAAVATRRR